MPNVFLRPLAPSVWAVPAFVGSAPARSPTKKFTVLHRLTFRPGDERAAALLRATPARRLVRGAFLMAMADLDDDGMPELVVQRLPRSGGADRRSTMVLKRRGGEYTALYYGRTAERIAVTHEKVGGFRGLAELDAGGGIRCEKDPTRPTFGRQLVHVIP
jgi:hypothetical protein